MPQKFWEHKCLKSGDTYLTGMPKGCDCGEPFKYVGWRHTSSEAKVWYQKRYGVKIIGPHRKYADEVFSGTSRPCSECKGTGYYDVKNGISYQVCSACSGAGEVSLISNEHIRGLRNIVLLKYPYAKVNWISRILMGK